MNVWTPAKSSNDRLPVLVWIYGGGFSGGSTSEPNYSGEKLAKKGVVVFTIGVGTPAGSEIHFVSEQGVPELVHDRKGQTVLSRLDEPTLTAIARATGGAYHPLGPLGEGLAKVRLAIDSLTTRGVSGPGRKLGVERYYLPIALALMLLVTESLLGTRRN